MSNIEELKKGMEEGIEQQYNFDNWLIFFMGQISASLALIADTLTKKEQTEGENDNCNTV